MVEETFWLLKGVFEEQVPEAEDLTSLRKVSLIFREMFPDWWVDRLSISRTPKLEVHTLFHSPEIHPCSCAVDDTGTYLYYTNRVERNISRLNLIDHTNESILSLHVHPVDFMHFIPMGLAFDNEKNRLLFCDSYAYSGVNALNLEEREIATIIPRSSEMQYCSNVLIEPKTRDLFISCPKGLLRFRLKENRKDIITKPKGCFSGNIALCPVTGNIICVSDVDHMITVVNPLGVCKQLSSQICFLNPYGVCIAPDGTVFVADHKAIWRIKQSNNFAELMLLKQAIGASGYTGLTFVKVFIVCDCACSNSLIQINPYSSF